MRRYGEFTVYSYFRRKRSVLKRLALRFLCKAKPNFEVFSYYNTYSTSFSDWTGDWDFLMG